ncbi:MAG: hypothetical protein ABL963_13885 [Longimicrobiales bacterium]
MRRPGLTALKSAAATIEYELSMLSAAFAETGNSKVHLHNMAVETFLLHARNLRDFFRSTGHGDDIRARDFVKTMPKISMPTVFSPAFNTRVNKKLAHPSYKRARLKAKWHQGKITRELVRAMDRFLSQLDADYPRRRAWFGAVTRLIAEAKRLGIA